MRRLKCGQGLIYQTEISLGFHGFAVVNHILSCYFIESAIDYVLKVAGQQLFGLTASLLLYIRPISTSHLLGKCLEGMVRLNNFRKTSGIFFLT